MSRGRTIGSADTSGINLDRASRKALQAKLKEQIDWLKEHDPKGESERMQGAKYAYNLCWKFLQKLATDNLSIKSKSPSDPLTAKQN